MAKIGEIQIETEPGAATIPIYEPADIGSGVYDIIRVETESGTGVMPLADPADAAFKQLEVPTQNNGTLAVHNNNIVESGWRVDWEGSGPNYDGVEQSSEHAIYGDFSGYVPLNADTVHVNDFDIGSYDEPNRVGFTVRVIDQTYQYDAFKLAWRFEDDPGNSVEDCTILFAYGGDEILFDTDNDNTYNDIGSWAKNTTYDVVLDFDWGVSPPTVEIGIKAEYDSSFNWQGPYDMGYPDYTIIHAMEFHVDDEMEAAVDDIFLEP